MELELVEGGRWRLGQAQHPVSVWCGSALQEELSSRRQTDAMAALALEEATLGGFVSRDGSWRLGYLGMIAGRSRRNAGTKRSKLRGLFPCQAIGLHETWIRNGKATVQCTRKRITSGQFNLGPRIRMNWTWAVGTALHSTEQPRAFSSS